MGDEEDGLSWDKLDKRVFRWVGLVLSNISAAFACMTYTGRCP